MASFETNYQPLNSFNENGEDTPQEGGMMIHVIPENSKARWNHIDDLDSFFTRIYHYHQNHGFNCMLLMQVMDLFKFLFVVGLSVFLLQCVDYSVLFHDKDPRSSSQQNSSFHKVTLGDAVIPFQQCVSNFSGLVVTIIIIAAIFWFLRVIKVIYHLFQYLEIKAFYSSALKISDKELDNITWHEVQRRMQEVQHEQQMCIHKLELTELDIYHRILRFKNYMVAMVNKSLLPVKFSIPFFGDVVFFTEGLKYNMELIFFWGPWAPFENNWHLKEDYKKAGKRKELGDALANHILWIGIINFMLIPIIFLWQILNFFFKYAEVIKREPGSLGARRWSIYGRHYLRHFNELDHELNARLSRAYRLSSRYINIFTSPVLTVIAKNGAFLSGSLLAVLLFLSVIDEDVLQVEHVLTIITVLSVSVAVCRAFIPNENLVWSPEKLMTSILAQIHYMPDHWRGNAHTTRVRDEFAQLFQYKAACLIEELISPIVCPYILCFCLRPKALDIVDFLRNFTVEVVGVGDVCSFAQMDIRKHGHPQWMHEEDKTDANQYLQAEDGKTELSLMHFTVTNPEWKPPQDSTTFMMQLRDQAQKDADMLHVLQEENPLFNSVQTISSLVAGYSRPVSSIFRPTTSPAFASTPSCDANEASSSSQYPRMAPTMKGGVSRTEGPVSSSKTSLLASVNLESLQKFRITPQTSPSQMGEVLPTESNASFELAAVDMSFSALYMHELHHRRFRTRGYTDSQQKMLWQRPMPEMPNIAESPHEDDDHAEKTPLLDTTSR